MVSWIERLGLRQQDIQSELEKFRLKSEREERPPKEFPKGSRESGFKRFESLFPEFSCLHLHQTKPHSVQQNPKF